MAGVTVVELAMVIAGPAAAAMLGDWGASVIKVEPPDGDMQRSNGTPSYFELDNRAKRSICLDLKQPEGLEVMLDLLDRADVFITSTRLGSLARLGLGPDELARRNPGLVYGLITGYGTSGCGAGKPGYDIGAFWSRSGVAASLVGPDADPPVPRPGLGDHPTGMALAGGIAAALFDRERTGRGRFVTTSLLRTGAYTISSDLIAQIRDDHPMPEGMHRMMFNPLLACYRAGDGRWFWLLGLEPTRHWPQVLKAVGRTDLLDDERFSSFGRLVRNGRQVIDLLDPEFAKRPLADWAEIFAAEDVWWDPVLDIPDMLDDPVVADAGVIRPTDFGDRTVATPVDFGGYEPPPAPRSPEVGEHTEEILLELGRDWAGIAGLSEAGVIP
ncbi:MAG: CaiB/BaiF CoA transferase family protein [Acidimicrobiales bacterium]